jgi:hypothetical protein
VAVARQVEEAERMLHETIVWTGLISRGATASRPSGG